MTGERAGFHQPDDVWFLAGTFGISVERRCAIPAGRPLFLPAFNMWHWPADGPPPPLPLAFGALVVDGRDIPLDVISTPVPFELRGVRGNPVAPSRSVPATVWGLWKSLEPLAPGAHTLRIAGGDGHGFHTAAIYHLTVA